MCLSRSASQRSSAGVFALETLVRVRRSSVHSAYPYSRVGNTSKSREDLCTFGVSTLICPHQCPANEELCTFDVSSPCCICKTVFTQVIHTISQLIMSSHLVKQWRWSIHTKRALVKALRAELFRQLLIVAHTGRVKLSLQAEFDDIKCEGVKNLVFDKRLEGKTYTFVIDIGPEFPLFEVVVPRYASAMFSIGGIFDDDFGTPRHVEGVLRTTFYESLIAVREL